MALPKSDFSTWIFLPESWEIFRKIRGRLLQPTRLLPINSIRIGLEAEGRAATFSDSDTSKKLSDLYYKIPAIQENITEFTHSFISELEEFLDVGNLPAYRSGSEVIQVSSYDRTGDNDDGFSGKYSYIRRNADSTLVIFEAKGNGVINRIWTPTPNNDTLDFYMGNRQKLKK